MLSPRRLLALGLLAALWLGPLPGLAAGSMVLHMVLHLGVTAVVPALWAPALRLPSGAMALVLGAVAEMLVVWVWHLPALHLWARLSTTGLVLEQGSFLGAGILLWATVRAAGGFGGAVVLLATTMHMTLLGALIGLAPRTLYGDICAGHLGLSALQEQQVAGALMAGAGGAIYLVAALRRLGQALELGETQA
ncbi:MULTISPECIES: cytochrome c oxidase assembly protein [unclassified Salipiger]|uniref:cytochrome c oxidase assembly protein n=1 Tax=unclassified Salipiger TaxID=2640570 RepID=UPI0013B87EA1|nr:MULTISPECIES: cytochrome c oxidase assembly protein [unclassified Salipiger]NDV51145.1 cytochrome c oxidase assembly protein [Salipiger sp. PrR003]NDW32914.1 cytochrome c oxidase assembly protein [Salipiger sp. PrR007]